MLEKDLSEEEDEMIQWVNAWSDKEHLFMQKQLDILRKHIQKENQKAVEKAMGRLREEARISTLKYGCSDSRRSGLVQIMNIIDARYPKAKELKS